MTDLVRFSVAIPEDLLMAFDALVAKRGVAKNRSEVIRDLIRDALVEEEWDTPGREIIGTLTLVFDNSSEAVRSNLENAKIQYHEQVVCSTRAYIDEGNCIEVMILRGANDLIEQISNTILGIKGIKHGHLTTTTTGKFI